MRGGGERRSLGRESGDTLPSTGVVTSERGPVPGRGRSGCPPGMAGCLQGGDISGTSDPETPGPRTSMPDNVNCSLEERETQASLHLGMYLYL